MKSYHLAIFSLLMLFLTSAAPREAKLRALYGSLDQRSVAQHLALYHLYPRTAEGQQALRDALKLLSADASQTSEGINAMTLPAHGIDALVSLVNKQPTEELPKLSSAELTLIESMGHRLHNRRLRGYRVQSEEELLRLPPHEIDLARGLFLSQLGSSPEALQEIRYHEALLDLMALQLLAQVSVEATPQEKIKTLNRFVFETMNFRFPPNSLYTQDIHVYTFLPSVLDTRRGVCLGVSILYTCLAQRLALPLELVTPPGHIFVRYRAEGKEINVETTLRGVHIDTEEYLSVDLKELQQRDLRETIGLAHINEASVYFQKKEYEKALASYLKAEKYLADDPLTQELTAYTYLLLGERERAMALLEPLRNHQSPYTIGKDPLVADLLDGRTDATGVAAIFEPCDEDAESLTKRCRDLALLLEKQPQFRMGWLQLGATHLKLHRTGEALESFKNYHRLDDQNASAEYTLAGLNVERLDYPTAWTHLRQAESIVALHHHTPECLEQLRRQLSIRCPE